MPTPFIMPKFDMDQETAKIANWVKSEGDQIKLDETVLVVETDKVAIDVPAPASGVLTGISYQAGDEVPVTTVIAFILAEGETSADIPADNGDAQLDEKIPAATPVEKEPSGSLAITPVAQRVADVHGVDVSQVPASGKRVTKADVEDFVKGQAGFKGRVKVAATPAARRLGREQGVDLAMLKGSGPRGRIQAEDVVGYQELAVATSQAAAAAGQEADIVPLDGMRARIADRMQTSFQTAPHIALSIEVDVSNLDALRQRLNLMAADANEERVTVTALLSRIVAWALGRNPYLNASLDGDVIKLWKQTNIGVAVALPEGLIVPVIQDANNKSVSQINTEFRELVEKARTGKLALSDIRGGTFTISNLGMFGIRHFRAIINPPESAILAVGEVVRKPVVVNQDDQVEVRPMMSITLSADHRVVDGVVAAQFLADLTRGIEAPDILIY